MTINNIFYRNKLFIKISIIILIFFTITCTDILAYNLIAEQTIQGNAEVGKDVKWTKILTVSNINDSYIDLSQILPSQTKKIIFDGNEIIGNQFNIQNSLNIDIQNIEYEYYTPAPQKNEYIIKEKNQWKKIVSVFHEGEYHYTQVLTSASITETPKDKIKLFWINGNDRIDITNDEKYLITYHDNNKNGLIDFIYWSVPQLSTKEFEIIVENITKNISFDLISPLENGLYNSGNILFEFNFSEQFGSCLLTVNPGSVNQFFIVQHGQNKFNLSLLDGKYNWDLKCFNGETPPSTLYQGNFSIDTLSPHINLNPNLNSAIISSPENFLKINLSSNETVNLTYSFNNLINSLLILENDTINITLYPKNGSNNFSITAVDMAQNTFIENFSFNFSFNRNLFCQDGIFNNNEQGVDCGGICSACVIFSVSTDKERYEKGEQVDIVVTARPDSYHLITIKGPNYSAPGITGQGPANYFVNLNNEGNYSINVTYYYLNNVENKLANIQVNSPSNLINLNIISNKNSIKVGEEIIFEANISGGNPPYNYFWDFNEDGINDSTTRTASHVFDSKGRFDVRLTVKDFKGNQKTVTKSISVKEEYEVKIYVHENITEYNLSNAKVNFDDENKTTGNSGLVTFVKFYGEYSLIVQKEGYELYAKDLTIESNATYKIFLNKKNRDITPPAITIISPTNNERINSDSATVKYKIYEDSPTNCTLYFGQYSNWLSIVVSSHLVPNDIEQSYQATGLKEGSQYWKVDCEDIYGNINSIDNKFIMEKKSSLTEIISPSTETVEDNLPTSEEEKRIEDKTKIIEEIIASFNSYDKINSEALEELGIRQKLQESQKEFKRIQRDLFNLKYRNAEDTQVEKNNLLEREKELSNNIINKIEVIKSLEYVKYDTNNEIEKFSEEYAEAKGYKLSSAEKSTLVQLNKEVSSHLTTSTKAKIVDLQLLNGEKKRITLIKKEININDNNTDLVLLEYIPKELADDSDKITFSTNIEVIKKDPIVKLDKEIKSITYYVEGEYDLNLTEKAKTFLVFESLPKGKNKITGAVTLNGIKLNFDPKTSILASLAVSLIIYLVFFHFDFKRIVVKKIIMKKKSEKYHKIKKVIEKANDHLNENNHKEAEKIYSEIKGEFNILNEKEKAELKIIAEELCHRLNVNHLNKTIRTAEDYLSRNSHFEASKIYPKICSIFNILPPEYKKKHQSNIINLGNRINTNYILHLVEDAHKHIKNEDRKKAHIIYKKIQLIYANGDYNLKNLVKEHALNLHKQLGGK